MGYPGMILLPFIEIIVKKWFICEFDTTIGVEVSVLVDQAAFSAGFHDQTGLT
jgi:hypothetical protein